MIHSLYWWMRIGASATRRDAFVSRTAPARVVVRVRVRSLGSRSVLSAAVRAVQTGEDLRRGTVAGVHRTQRASHDVIAPLFPLLKVLRQLSNARHALGLGGGEARARDELSRAKERAQTHGAADGDEDGVHLDARARVVRQSFGSRYARVGSVFRAVDRRLIILGYPFAVASSRASSSRRSVGRRCAPLVSTNAGRTSNRSCRRRRRRRRLASAVARVTSVPRGNREGFSLIDRS